MKKLLLLLVCVSSLHIGGNAQVTIDTVSLGAGYVNQKWYSLQNDEQGSAPKNNWDIAFDVSGYGSSIHVNSVIGTLLWKYPIADTSGWSTLDTAGITTWKKLYNSDTSWAFGAFDKGMNFSTPFDLGWGIYNSTTHIVTGDSLFVIKLASGVYKKLWIINLNSGAYNFKYADLNGANPQTAQLVKSTYTGKNFGYYSLQNNTALDREPLSANWDLIFTQYTAFIPSPYTVAGILHNKGITTAQVEPIANPNTYNSWLSHAYNRAINEIGYDWKTFTGSWIIDDSLVYFVKSNSGNVWKVIPIGFGGSSTGSYLFSKEKLSATEIQDNIGNITASMSVYPNPSSGSTTNIVYSLEHTASSAALSIHDLVGNNIFSDKLNNRAGFFIYNLNTFILNTGMYIVSITIDGQTTQQKLIIQ
jgi:hypothetical protein